MAGAQGTTVHRGIVGSRTYTGVTYNPAAAAIQREIAQVEGQQRSNNIRNQADEARFQYASKILKAKELKPGEKVSGSLWTEIPYERSGVVYFNIYTSVRGIGLRLRWASELVASNLTSLLRLGE